MDKKMVNDFSVAFWNFIPEYHRFMHNYYTQQSQHSLAKNKKKALMVIYHHGEMYMSRLGECIELQKGSLTSLVDSLEAEGYIKRLQQSGDRRKTLLTLTPKAVELIKNRKKEMKEFIVHAFENISATETKELVLSLQKITGILKKL